MNLGPVTENKPTEEKNHKNLLLSMKYVRKIGDNYEITKATFETYPECFRPGFNQFVKLNYTSLMNFLLLKIMLEYRGTNDFLKNIQRLLSIKREYDTIIKPYLNIASDRYFYNASVKKIVNNYIPGEDLNSLDDVNILNIIFINEKTILSPLNIINGYNRGKNTYQNDSVNYDELELLKQNFIIKDGSVYKIRDVSFDTYKECFKVNYKKYVSLNYSTLMRLLTVNFIRNYKGENELFLKLKSNYEKNIFVDELHRPYNHIASNNVFYSHYIDKLTTCKPKGNISTETNLDFLNQIYTNKSKIINEQVLEEGYKKIIEIVGNSITSEEKVKEILLGLYPKAIFENVTVSEDRKGMDIKMIHNQKEYKFQVKSLSRDCKLEIDDKETSKPDGQFKIHILNTNISVSKDIHKHCDAIIFEHSYFRKIYMLFSDSVSEEPSISTYGKGGLKDVCFKLKPSIKIQFQFDEKFKQLDL